MIAEVAVLQDFPPDWRFAGTKEEQYRQVGNAVCPTLAYVVVKALTGGRP